MLEIELENLKADDIDMGVFQFDDLIKVSDDDLGCVPQNFADEGEKTDEISEGMACLMPPLSVLNCAYGNWFKRKKQWKAAGLTSGLGREDDLLGDGLKKLANAQGDNDLSGTSIFDPALCEQMYKWFNVPHGLIYDCFAGGSVRGIVAMKMGYDYIGIDLRQEQVDANYDNALQMDVSPTWICDDSLNADLYLEDEMVDMIFSCPPYADLEVYSDNPKDLSTMEYDEFVRVYTEIIKIACKKLKPNRFAVFVVGEVRDKKGYYRDFIGDTKRAFRESGLVLYNDIVYREAGGTHALRAGRQFNALRKTVKCHQNVLVFYKGDTSRIPKVFPHIDTNQSTLDWLKVQSKRKGAE